MTSRRTVLRSAGIVVGAAALGQAGLLASPAAAVTGRAQSAPTGAADGKSSAVPFKTQLGGTYDGMPLFDGDPRHLGPYLNTLVAYAGIEAAANWANGIRGDFTIPSGPNAGKVVPGAPQWDEGLQGFSTDFPASIASAQSWNQDLLQSIGEVIGGEKLYTQSFLTPISGFNAMVASPVQDVRPNPLSGRLDEGFGEDPYLASVLIDNMSRGISGIDAVGNAQGFWTTIMETTKHFTAYAAEWFRVPGNIDVGARAERENWSRPALKSFKSGALGSVLTAYGRTNGVPNSISPLISYLQSLSPWGGLYSTPDNGAERQLQAVNAYSNGFDTSYTPTWNDAAALFAIAQAGSIGATGSTASLNAGLIACAQDGTYGVTTDDILTLAKTQMLPLVRMGLFNERDTSGYPVGYPFLNRSALSPTPIDSSVPGHQATALAAAQQSIVLLKNNGVLPLESGTRVAVVGAASNARFRTSYASRTTPNLPDSGLTPVQGITAIAGSSNVATATDGQVVVLKSMSKGQYLVQGTGTAPSVSASAAAPSAATSFEDFAWGQGAHSYRSLASGNWLQFAGSAINVGGTQQFGTSNTSIPYRLRVQKNDDGTVSLLAETYGASFFGPGFETLYYASGRYLTVNSDGSLGVTAVLANAANAALLNTASTKFVMETMQSAGSQAAAFKRAGTTNAIVVIGAPPTHSAGEGADRSDMSLDDQYTLVENVAAAYPGKAIVVLANTTPVIAGAIHDNPNVAAIVQSPYAGQYGAYALAQVLFGEYAPTGRLAQTWYADLTALPALDDYSIPEGTNTTVTRADLDPRFTVDMTNGDPVETRLTYKYTNAPVTYEFGYGLSYSRFEYGNLKVTASNGNFAATVDVTNAGRVNTSEVVQLYAAAKSSAYAQAAPQKQLMAFQKVDISAGRTVTVNLPFDPSTLALWDPRTQALAVESGPYEFQAGSSSRDIKATTNAQLHGQTFDATDASRMPINVYDFTFATSAVTYREASKQNTVNGLNANKTVNGYYAVMSRRAGAWAAVSRVKFAGTTQVTLSVASINASSSIELRLDGPAGQLIGQATFSNTGVSSYTIPGSIAGGDIPVKEIGYNKITITLNIVVGGVHDLYIVFGDRDIRVRDVHLTSSRA